MTLDIEPLAAADWMAMPGLRGGGDQRLLSRERFQRHYRSGRYQRPESSRSGIKLNLLNQPLCAIDGEGKSRADGSHDYTLLAASWPADHTRIQAQSLSTADCCDFLLDLPADHTYVVYGGSYDFNMILRDLPIKSIDALLDAEDHRVSWRGYRIEWIERKYMQVSRAKRCTRVYDVLQNFQRTFVGACVGWNVGSECTQCGARLHAASARLRAEQFASHPLTDLDIVQGMKEQRAVFDALDDAAISDYCYLECDLLRGLCRRFFDAILKLPYRPRAVYGPGALAAAAFKTHKVLSYKVDPPEPVNELARYAYFGGRFDIAMTGFFEHVWQHDIKSAYPDQIRFLPCLKHASWRKVTRGRKPLEPAKYGLYHVVWDVSDSSPWPPFPFRIPNGCVYYPVNGEGWYHGDEVRAAIELYGPRKIKVTHGWEVVPGCEHRPFDFVDNLFTIRASMPYEQGVVIKLILNSLYGKLAQQVGGRNGKPPPYQSFYWAGAITAGTRAKILRGLRDDPANVIGIATDSLVAERRLDDLPIGAALGEWDVKRLTRYAQISNGVYLGFDDAGEPIERSRGFGRATLDWNAVERQWRATNGVGKFEFTTRSRFVTRREARNYLDRKDRELRWITETNTITFLPARRWPDAYNKRLGQRRLTALAVEQIQPPVPPESQPFPIKTDSRAVIEARERFHAYAWQDME